jgi:hypothetical protein
VVHSSDSSESRKRDIARTTYAQCFLCTNTAALVNGSSLLKSGIEFSIYI